MQQDNHGKGKEAFSQFAEDMSRLMGSAMSTAAGVSKDVGEYLRKHMEPLIDSMQLVRREEFEVVKSMLAEARKEQEVLRKELEALKKESHSHKKGEGKPEHE